ncbi:hypothetical protein GCM10023320_23850 [Pseudonocardia adelaidensis]|uniref:Uncharacterized protein n=1 Tax=Pseudonocardia adelaidensis TaxID=648754 RepID=A0ABP9NM13_9PSEU
MHREKGNDALDAWSQHQSLPTDVYCKGSDNIDCAVPRRSPSSHSSPSALPAIKFLLSLPGQLGYVDERGTRHAADTTKTVRQRRDPVETPLSASRGTAGMSLCSD